MTKNDYIVKINKTLRIKPIEINNCSVNYTRVRVRKLSTLKRIEEYGKHLHPDFENSRVNTVKNHSWIDFNIAEPFMLITYSL